MVKDTDGKHVDPINSVLVVVPVCSVVAAQQRSGLVALVLRDMKKQGHQHVSRIMCCSFLKMAPLPSSES